MKQLLVLDIDETLLHSTYEDLKKEPDFFFKERRVYLRPHVLEFIDFCLHNYDVAIWTSAKAVYAKFVLKHISADLKAFKFIWTRKHCQKKLKWNGFMNQEFYLKDLNNIVGYTTKDILIIDDSPQNITPFDCCLSIDEYRGDATDHALKELMSTLHVNCK
ncbi:MAG: NIF family HAD-type phosphatase [Bacteroidales bacterium]